MVICLHWAPKAFELGDDGDVKASMCEESGRSDFSLQSSFECSGAPARMIIRLMYGGESTFRCRKGLVGGGGGGDRAQGPFPPRVAWTRPVALV